MILLIRVVDRRLGFRLRNRGENSFEIRFPIQSVAIDRVAVRNEFPSTFPIAQCTGRDTQKRRRCLDLQVLLKIHCPVFRESARLPLSNLVKVYDQCQAKITDNPLSLGCNYVDQERILAGIA